MHSPAHIQKASDSGFSRARKRPVIQAELEVGKPGDKYEQEADAVAQRVMMQPSMEEEEAVQMQPAADEEELQMQTLEEEELQMQAFGEEEELQMEQMAGEEEEMLQMTAVDEEEAVQMQAEEEEAIQMEMAGDEEEMLQMYSNEKEETLQTKPAVQAKDGGGLEASPALASKISSTKGTGSPLEPGIQREMGGKMGADFSGVNIHTGRDAAAMSSEIGARAFTVGSDVYFNKDQYNPHSSSGKHLLAHELTHTVQQGASAQRKIQRDDENDASGNNGAEQTEFELSDGTKIKRSGIPPADNPAEGRRIEVKGLTLPSLKERNSTLFPSKIDLRPYSRQESDTQQGDLWKNALESNIEGYVEELRAEAEEKGGYHQESQTSYMRSVNNPNLLIIGKPENLVRTGIRPFWSKTGEESTFHIDHIVEDQLVNPLDTRGSGFTADSTDNFELLEAGANRSSGQRLYHAINQRLRKVTSDYADEFPEIAAERPLNYGAIRHGNYFVNFENYNFNLSVDEGAYWSFDEIRYGEHLRSNHIEPLTGEELAELGMDGDNPKIFLSPTGGQFKPLPDEVPVNEWFPRINLKEKHLNEDSASGDGSYLVVDVFKKDESPDDPIAEGYSNMRWPLQRVEGIYAWAVDVNAVRSEFLGPATSLELRGLSPIRLEEFSLTNNGIFARGVVLPTVELIGGTELSIILDGDDIRVQAELNSGEINLPSPFSITNAQLIIALGTQRGLSVEGGIDFIVEHLGTGSITASASTAGGFELEGAFNFDSELFDPAAIEVEYKDETWTIGGQIGIPEGKVRGVKSATINATYSEGNFAATGEAELDIPGIERGTMEVNYGEEGFSIGGAFDLSSDIPGIQSGRVEATVSKESGDEEYSVSVAGTARPDIPGVDSTLSIAYNDGAITIEGTADYNRGMLSGTVRLGATNRAIDDNGQPEGEPDDTMRVYGGGSLTLQLTPWLEATAGVTFLPNGEMEVQGRIGLPGTVDVFPRRQIRRNLFTVPTIEIPLFAIPLGPRSIGLVAQIGGGLDFEAGFGPGQLRELYAEVTYNPDREDETTLHGRGVFAIPADAGLTLRGDLGLGVSVAIASLSGGIELAGTLGLEGEALASVDVNWSPQTGIALDAEGRVTVNPKFEFNLNAFARATLGIGWFSVSETWRHRLAGFEWGPDIQFGIVFPVQYREGEPFDLSFDDIEVIYPELDIPNMAKGLARDVKDDLF